MTKNATQQQGSSRETWHISHTTATHVWTTKWLLYVFSSSSNLTR